MCAMQVVVLAGSHWSQLPPLNIWWVPSQLWSRSSMKVSARLPTSGRNGGTTVAPSAWYQTGLPLGQRHRMRIAEPTHSAHHAEVVVERPVLLHQHHDVLDVPQRPCRPVRRDRQRAGDAVRQHRRRDATTR